MLRLNVNEQIKKCNALEPIFQLSIDLFNKNAYVILFIASNFVYK